MSIVLSIIPSVFSLVHCIIAVEEKNYRLALAWGTSCLGWTSVCIELLSKI